MYPIVEKLGKYGIVPVIKIERIEDAVPLAKALCQGGLPVAEVTFRTDCAAEAIKAMKQACPDMLIGAGTVLNNKQVDEAIEAGSEFIISPGFNPNTVAYCLEKNYPIIPGTSCPSDMEKAIEFGLDVVKFFPAEASGGLKSIKAMSAPYGQLKFMPTGGINPDNLNSYLEFDKIIACGGTWMVPNALVKEKRFDEIAELTRLAVLKMLDIQFDHVGINSPKDQSSSQIAHHFSQLLGAPLDTKPASIFVDRLEVMPAGSPGTNGHLGFSTANLQRAIFFLEKAGYTFDYETVRKNELEEITFIYLKEEIGGMACHLIDKKVK